MPIYEYRCRKCSHDFEEIVLSGENSQPRCPDCGSEKTEKLMSCGNVRTQGIPKGSGGFKGPACKPSGGG